MPRKKKDPVEEKEKDPNAPWLSNWFITYNTNRAEEAFIYILEEAWRYILTNIDRYLYAYSSDQIKLLAIKEHHAIERGPKFKRIHLHCDLSVDSEGLSMLNYTKIKIHMNRFIRRMYRIEFGETEGYKEYKGGACWVRLNPGANRARTVEQYLSKAPLIIPKKTVLK